MTTPQLAPPGRQTTHHRPAAAPPPTFSTARGARKAVARRASDQSLDPIPQDGRYPVAWLLVRCPGQGGATPYATSRCHCGRAQSVSGRAAVMELIASHTEHRDHCPHHTPRTAA